VNWDFAKKWIFWKIYNYWIDNTNYFIAQNNNQIKYFGNWKKKNIENIKVIKIWYDIDKNIDKKYFSTRIWTLFSLELFIQIYNLEL